MDDADVSVTTPWVLPERYNGMLPPEQTDALRGAILAYLRSHGRAARSVLFDQIQPPRRETFQKAIDFLATTQQIYVDFATGSRDPVYYTNGRLAHPVGEREIMCGPNTYVIAAYEDKLAGRTITLTQFAQLPNGDRRPMSGIRFDWQDLPTIIDALSDAKEGLAVERMVDYGE